MSLGDVPSWRASNPRRIPEDRVTEGPQLCPEAARGSVFDLDVWLLVPLECGMHCLFDEGAVMVTRRYA